MPPEDQNANVGDKGKEGSAAPDSSVDPVEALKAENEKLKKHNADLLSEKKSVSTKLTQIEKERLEAEEKTQKEKGEFKSLYEKESEKNLKLAESFKGRVYDSQIKDALRAAGCTDEKKLSTLMKLETVKGYTSKVKFDESHEADKEALAAFVSSIVEEVSDLGFFAQEVPPTKETHPSGGASTTELNDFKTKAKLVLAGLGGL